MTLAMEINGNCVSRIEMTETRAFCGKEWVVLTAKRDSSETPLGKAGVMFDSPIIPFTCSSLPAGSVYFYFLFYPRCSTWRQGQVIAGEF